MEVRQTARLSDSEAAKRLKAFIITTTRPLYSPPDEYETHTRLIDNLKMLADGTNAGFPQFTLMMTDVSFREAGGGLIPVLSDLSLYCGRPLELGWQTVLPVPPPRNATIRRSSILNGDMASLRGRSPMKVGAVTSDYLTYGDKASFNAWEGIYHREIGIIPAANAYGPDIHQALAAGVTRSFCESISDFDALTVVDIQPDGTFQQTHYRVDPAPAD
jgi:hypothetical protein